MTIHNTHPFADPDPDPARRLRGRLGGAVTLWTTGRGAERAGLTLTSVLVAPGEPARVIGLVDPDSDLAEQITDSGPGTATVVLQLLAWGERGLAEVFAGTAPAPGGAFAQAAFVDTAWGPRLGASTSWAGLRLESTTALGWSSLVTCTLEHVEIGPDTDPLLHRRGRWHRP